MGPPDFHSAPPDSMDPMFPPAQLQVQWYVLYEITVSRVLSAL